MNQKQQFLTQAEQSLNQLSGTVNTVLTDIRNYGMQFALAFNQQPGETATNSLERGLTMYDKFSESLQRVGMGSSRFLQLFRGFFVIHFQRK